jgi:hypothetical protein
MFEIQKAKQIFLQGKEVQNIKDSAGNIIWQKCDYLYLPLNENKYGKSIAVQLLEIKAGDKITIYWYNTDTSGYVCDFSNCGGSSVSPGIINQHHAYTYTATKTGKFIVAGQYSRYQWGIDWPGSIAGAPFNGDYIKIKIN